VLGPEIYSIMVDFGYTMLAVVPARGGSRGVRRKNLRIVDGLPLIAHTVNALRSVEPLPRIVVSSDDDEILGWAQSYGVETITRAPELSGSEVPVVSVALDAVHKTGWHGIVGIFQPTSPLRTAESISKALSFFVDTGAESLASVHRQRHLHWLDTDDDLTTARPLYEARVNRQYSHQPILVETGSIQLIHSESLLKHQSTVSENHVLLEEPEEEYLDIDTIEDLRIARARFARGLVVFRLTANIKVGSGHLFHCLQLAEYLDHHQVFFILKDCDQFAHEVLEKSGWNFQKETNFVSELTQFSSIKRKVLINDILDTDESDVLQAKQNGYSVVNIEDLGGGAKFADVVVNALYAEEIDRKALIGKLYTGSAFAPLRSEFLGLNTNPIRDEAKEVLVTFGGTDPNNLTARIVNILSQEAEISISVILGLGVGAVKLPSEVSVKRNIKNMAREMRDADVVITAAGRTVFESAIVGTPVIVIAQSAREATHSHLGIENGVLFLGIGPLVSDSDIRETTLRLLGNRDLRADLSSRLRNSIDGRGAARITQIIENLLGETL
jgi:CMP-N-acetylneuraminic acid synthetase/spore coat polysaccharide biosynthesis predicted glycosyltransferase SpsG